MPASDNVRAWRIDEQDLARHRPGFDDWMAWALPEADPGIEPMGVSVVVGNAPLPNVPANARRSAAFHGWATRGRWRVESERELNAVLALA